MKIAFVSPPPDRTWVDKFGWLVESFATLGHETRRIHHVSDLADADTWAELVIFDQYAAGLPPGNFPAVAESKSKTAIWLQCWRDLICTDPAKPVGRQETFSACGRVMRSMDVVCIKERHRVDEFRSARVNAVYLDAQACPGAMQPCTYAEKPEFDVLVIGQADRAYADRRADAAALVKAGYKVLWAGRTNTAAPHGVHGHAWVHPLEDLPALASRCACALSVDLRHEPGYTSDRTYLLAGCGVPVIARVPDVDDCIGLSALADVAPQADVASWIYSDMSGLVKCVEQAVKNPADRRRRGEQGRARVFERHLYKHRARAILDRLAGVSA